MTQAHQDAPSSIYTIGHSNHSQAVFLELLRLHAIEVLIDTRSFPFSRYSPQFNRDVLKSAVQEIGIRYGFYGRELGGRPEDKQFYDPDGRVSYFALVQSPLFNDGMERLVSGLTRFRTALLCSEEDPAVCHRRLLISHVLFEQGVSVQHIRGDGRLETEQDLREVEARLAEEREHCAEGKIKEKQAAVERKLQAVEVRRVARREREEEATHQKLQRQQELAEIRAEKEYKRRQAAEHRAAERARRAAEREAPKVRVLKAKAQQMPQKTAAPRLFDVKEV